MPGGGWAPTTGTELVASDGAASDSFGDSVGVSGSTVVSGAYAHDFNAVDQGAAYEYTLTAPPQITSADSTTFSVGSPGSFTVTATGEPGGPTLTLSDGGATLPSGVTFVDNGNGTATLSGTPAAGSAGIYKFTITADNGVSPNATQSFTLTVASGGGAPEITSGDSASFSVGSPGSFTVSATGEPGGPTLTLSDGGATLPSGVTFVDNGNGTATLSGTPAAGSVGSYPFTITAANGVPPNATQSFTLTVVAAPTINPTTDSSVTATTATLNWTVQPDGDDLYFYNVICTPTNGNQVQVRATGEPPAGAIPADFGSHPLATAITGLQVASTYHCILQMGDLSGADYSSFPAYEAVTTGTPAFIGFSSTTGAGEQTAVLNWTIDPENDSLTSYSASCTSAAGNVNKTGGIGAGVLPADAVMHTLTLDVGLITPARYACALSLTDAGGRTFHDVPRVVIVPAVVLPPTTITGFTEISIECNSSGPCPINGTVESGSEFPAHQSIELGDVATAKPVVLGHFRAVLKPHSRKRIRIKETAAGRRFIRAHHRFKTTLILTVTVHGHKLTTRTPLTIIRGR